MKNNSVLFYKVECVFATWLSNSTPGYTPKRNSCAPKPGDYAHKYSLFVMAKQIEKKWHTHPEKNLKTGIAVQQDTLKSLNEYIIHINSPT